MNLALSNLCSQPLDLELEGQAISFCGRLPGLAHHGPSVSSSSASKTDQSASGASKFQSGRGNVLQEQGAQNYANANLSKKITLAGNKGSVVINQGDQGAAVADLSTKFADAVTAASQASKSNSDALTSLATNLANQPAPAPTVINVPSSSGGGPVDGSSSDFASLVSSTLAGVGQNITAAGNAAAPGISKWWVLGGAAVALLVIVGLIFKKH